MDNFVNIPDSNGAEMRIALEDLNSKSVSFDSSLNYSYGVLTFYSKIFACIKPAFFNSEFTTESEFSHPEIAIFNPSKASIEGEPAKINSQKYVYLVRYVDGGLTTNEKTGELQPTVDYSVPISVLTKHSKKQCVHLFVNNGFVLIKSTESSDSIHEHVNDESIITELNSTAIQKLITTIKSEINKLGLGFVYASEFPRYLERSVGTKEVKRYASNVSDFVELYLSEYYRYESQYSYNGKIIPGVLLPCKVSGRETFDDCVRAIDAAISLELSNNQYILASRFPMITKQCGLLNFREFADSVELFLEKYLPHYVLLKNVTVGGKTHPGIIIEKENTTFECNTTVKQDSTNESKENTTKAFAFELLDQLFAEKRYSDVLSSDILKECPPQDLPIETLEVVVNAANRLLFPDINEHITLNDFQKEVFYSSTSITFIKKWKYNGFFATTIMEQCADSAIARFSFPDDSKLVAKLLNAIGFTESLNSSYNGIIKRFAACENVLLPNFYIIRAFVQPTSNSIQKIISEYCQLVKDLKQSSSGPRLTNDLRLCSFSNVLKVVNNYLMDVSTLPQNIRINVVSSFVEYGELDYAREVINLWDPCHNSVEWRTIDLYFNIDSVNEHQILSLISDGVNLQLLQKCVSILWSKYSNESILPKKFIALLSYIIIYDSPTSIDEIVRYPSSKELNRVDKMKMLVDSYGAICEYSIDDNSMYVLASYIVQLVQPVLNSEAISDYSKERLSGWLTYSENFYTDMISKNGILSEKTESSFIRLFSLFQVDKSHYFQLQKTYADWYNEKHSETRLTTDELKSNLESLYAKKAFAAYISVFLSNRQQLSGEDSEHYESLYVHSLISMHKYGDAIDFLNKSSMLSTVPKHALLSKALSENFREYGLSPAAYSIFNESFTCSDAIGLLRSELKWNQAPAINSLIALYIHEREFMKAAYLKTVFSSIVEKGYARLQAQFNSLLGKYIDFNKLKSRHHVIEQAFRVLTPERLVQFLTWVEGVKVPAFKQRKETHILHSLFDTLTANATSREKWIDFLQHLLKNGIDKNSWYVCVCESVLNRVFQGSNMSNSEIAFDHLLRSDDLTSLPAAFLVYALGYIKDGHSANMCQKLADALSSDRVKQILINENSWIELYNDEIDDLKKYLLASFDETGNSAYYELLIAFDYNLTINELKSLPSSSSIQRSLISRICQNYLDGHDLEGSYEALYSDDLSNLPDAYMEIVNILRGVFDDDTLLLYDNPDLFENEESVSRFKRDCVNILKEYPEKTGLYSFNSSCRNEYHKMLVYSYVFRVLYDQDVYEALDKQYSDFANKHELKCYLALLKTAYRAQSIKNTTFPSFYKKWRYLKLYLACFIDDHSFSDDSSIVSLMEYNEQYDDYYASSYVPFVNDVKDFWSLTNLSVDFKEHFLFSIMVSEPDDLYSARAYYIAQLSERDKAACRRLIESLDYRYFNASLYNFFWNSIKARDYSICLNVAAAVSTYAFDAVKALSESDSSGAIMHFEKVTIGKTPFQAANEVNKMNETVFLKYSKVLIPLLCSRQFVFHINDRFRYLIINRDRNSELVCKKHSMISDYLFTTGLFSAKTVSNYLWALYYCQLDDREHAYALALNNDFLAYVPEQWKKEAKAIIEYSNGTLKKFSPDKSIRDGSKENTDHPTDIGFANVLFEKLFPDARTPASNEEAVSLYRKYKQYDDAWEKLNQGLALLTWISNSKYSRTSKLPSLNDFALEVGLMVLRAESEVSIEDKFLVASALFNNRETYSHRKYSVKFDEVNKVMLSLINSKPDLRIWIRYADAIEDVLKENQALLDFKDLRKNILNECISIDSPEIDYTEKERRYNNLLNSFGGMRSTYSKGIRSAIEQECAAFGDGIRLSIVLENRDITDGNIYFQIENIGKRPVSLANDGISVILHQDNQPEIDALISDIGELQCSSMIGGSVGIVLPPDGGEVTGKICVYKSFSDNHRELVCSATSIFKITVSESLTIQEDAHYKVDKAVLEEDLLFGRDTQKRNLEKYIPDGVTLIYGPSRIGKTSLMNWVRRTLAKKQGNVLTISIGGEAENAKGTDYTRNIIAPSNAIHYDDDDAMSQYLLVDTVVYGLEHHTRLGLPATESGLSGLKYDLLKILKDTATDIQTKYYELNERLSEANIELWLMLDEFQQVVGEGRWTPNEYSQFKTVCSLLCEDEKELKLNNIKLIVCGSDDLLKYMTLKHDSVWKSVFRRTIPVGALLEEPFKEMIEKDPAVVGTNLHYSPYAIHALYNYTGGVALYGKEICNAVLQELLSNEGQRTPKTWVYTVDISNATQRLLQEQSNELNGLSISEKEGVSRIYSAVTKNLEFATDKQMLWYMAKWLYENKKSNGFPIREFMDAMLTPRFKDHLEDSINIAEARGIIKKVHEHGSESLYAFTTLFYSNAFYGSAKGNLDGNLIFAQDDEIISEIEPDAEFTVNLADVKATAKAYKRLSVDDQEILIGALATASPDYVQKKLRGISGQNQSGNIVNGDVDIRILQVNQIADTIDGLSSMVKGIMSGETEFSDEKISGFMSELPRLSLLPAGNPVNEDDDLSMFDTDSYAEAVGKGVKKSFESNAEFKGKTLMDWALDHIGQLSEMGISEDDLDYAKTLLDVDRDSVLIAVYLRSLFDDIVTITERANSSMTIDYSPITILLSKPLERTLKEKHLPIYLDKSVWKNQVSTYSRKEGFQPSRITFNGLTTIGTFKTALFAMFKILDSDPEKEAKEENRDRFVQRTGTSARNWKNYMYDLDAAYSIRNKTAHVEPVTQELCDRFVELVFRMKLLKNTREFISDSISD